MATKQAINFESIDEYKAKVSDYKPEAFNFRGNPKNKAYVKDFQTKNELSNEGQALDFIIKFFQATWGKGKDSLAELSARLTKALSDKKEVEDKLATTTEALEKLQAAPSLTYVDAKELAELRKQKKNTADEMEKFLNALFVKYPHLQTTRHLIIADDYLQLADDLVKPFQEQAEQATAAVSMAAQDPEYRKLKEELEKTLPKLFKMKEVERIPVSETLFVKMLVELGHTDKQSIFPSKELAQQALNEYHAK